MSLRTFNVASGTPAEPPLQRILLVGPSLDILGGQAVQLARLLTHFRGTTGIQVDFLPVNPRLWGPLRALQRVKYVRTIATSVAYVATLFRRVPHYDVVHAFSASYYSYLLAPLPALMAGRLYHKRTLLNYHSGEADDHLTNWRSAVPTMRHFADAIVVPSGYLVDVFRQYGLAARAIFNFVDAASLPNRERDELRPVFFSNRNLEPLYNVRCTLDAFAIVQREIPDARLVVAGDGSERKTLETHAYNLNLHNVRFIGRVPPDRMGELYAEADIYLNSSNIDNMPISIIEAFAAGLPVVTTDAGGIPYIVRHDETGLMVKTGDSAALGAAAFRLLREPGLGARLSTAAREECLRQYVWPVVEAQWQALYTELLKGRELASR